MSNGYLKLRAQGTKVAPLKNKMSTKWFSMIATRVESDRFPQQFERVSQRTTLRKFILYNRLLFAPVE